MQHPVRCSLSRSSSSAFALLLPAVQDDEKEYISRKYKVLVSYCQDLHSVQPFSTLLFYNKSIHLHAPSAGRPSLLNEIPT